MCDEPQYSDDRTVLEEYPLDEEESSFTVPNTVVKIGDSAFSGNTYLEDVGLPNSVTEIGDSAFRECISLYGVILPDSLEKIGAGAFQGCTMIDGFELPDSLKEIGEEAFANCPISSITIPGSLEILGGCAFNGCYALEYISVDKNNEHFESIDGVLYSKDGILIRYPPARKDTEFKVPDFVTEIGAGAFEYCTNLTSIILPDSVKKIGKQAFKQCKGLTSMTGRIRSQRSDTRHSLSVAPLKRSACLAHWK